MLSTHIQHYTVYTSVFHPCKTERWYYWVELSAHIIRICVKFGQKNLFCLNFNHGAPYPPSIYKPILMFI